jgi:hypothetical protein
MLGRQCTSRKIGVASGWRPTLRDEAMKKLIINVKEPRGGSVIKSASGAAVHVAKPRGEAYLSKLGSGGVIDRASAARRRALSA